MTFNLSEFLNKPLQVGSRTIPGRLVLAPLSKLGNVAFRELLAGYGGYGLMFSEMSSSRAVQQGVRNTVAGFMWRPEELDALVCQIFGDDPKTMGLAARQVENNGFFGVDINFGCSVGAICRHGCGAQLLKEPDLAVRIVAAVRRQVSIPLFIKYRTGWQDDPEPAVDLARRFEDAGADALTFHPRVAPDRRTRPPKWAYIAKVKETVSIPVFGNGNVFSAEDCAVMLRSTNCDGVALGRLAIARPWIFSQWTRGVKPAQNIFKACALDMIDLIEKHFESAVAMRRLNRFFAYYAANFKFGHTLYARMCRAQTPDDARLIMRNFYREAPETVAKPKISLMR
ncbi:MAG: tRNA-dihydrouridine synthase family protein [Desulfobacterales bacterium]|nr:tRNA-dihydrouridine synthase family protein [Desulfobacterales bacterium]